MSEASTDLALWPEESPASDGGEPDTELAVILLAAGCSQSFIRTRCNFESNRAVQAFCRDDDVRREANELAADRVKRIGKRASVCLEQILNTPQTDLRAQVLAIRTGLELAGELKRENAAPTKSVKELSAAELGELIAVTRQELSERVGRYRAGGHELDAKLPALSDT
jgi:hypothetical protein